MEILAKKLKEKAKLYGVSNAEMARRLGLEERRYAHYVAGRREPDWLTLAKIAKGLKTTPNELLGFEPDYSDDENLNTLINRFVSAAHQMKISEAELCVVQAEAIAARNSDKK